MGDRKQQETPATLYPPPQRTSPGPWCGPVPETVRPDTETSQRQGATQLCLKASSYQYAFLKGLKGHGLLKFEEMAKEEGVQEPPWSTMPNRKSILF